MRIAIVGGGASGTSVLDSLVRHHDGAHPLTVTVYEPHPRNGPGRAFAPGSPAAVLNQPANGITLRPDDPHHFLDWLTRTRTDPPDPGAFLPRDTFGEYLADAFQEARSDGLARGVRSDVVGARVTAITRTADGSRYRLHTLPGDGRPHTFDAVFLCTGSSSPQDAYGLTGHPQVTPDPYPLSDGRHRHVPADATVAVIGTGLSATDVVHDLAAHGHLGPIHLLSRTGRLPAVRDHATPAALALDWPRAVQARVARDGRLRLRDIHRLAVEELAAHGLPAHRLHQEFDPREHPHARLARHVDEAHRGDPWHALRHEVVMTVLEGEGVWDRMDATARRALRTWHPELLALCAQLPLPSADTLNALVNQGQLTVTAGLRAITPRPDTGGFLLHTGARPLHADHIVNTARPHTASTPQLATDLVAALLRHRLAAPDPLGGLRTDPVSSELVGPGGTITPRLYAFGQLAYGTCYLASSSLHMITRRVTKAVRLLLPRSTHTATAGPVPYETFATHGT